MYGRPSVAALVFALICAAVSSCSKPVDLKQAAEFTDVSSGWFDAGIQDGKNKLVPSVTFRIKQKGQADLSSLSLNVVFKIEGEEDHSDDVFVQRVDFSGDATAPITVRSKFGYTGDPPQSRAEMLKNSQFRDMEAQIFAKQGSGQWVELYQAKIERQLLTQ